MQIKRQPPNFDRTSDQCVEQLQVWISDCVANHDACRHDVAPQLPTRVIDVGSRDGKTDPRLALTDGENENYIALSYCWGPPSPTHRKMGTSNFEDMLQGFPLDSMPQTLQDAIIMTRCLGVRYLWIDSLCIIQDSTEDWEKESALMDSYYKCAYVTLAATSAAKSEDGFLQYQLADTVTRVPYFDESTQGSDSKIVVMAADGITGHWERQLEGSIWNDRAWTMQERYLSRRTIHFCRQQIYWECRSAHRSETNEPIAHLPLTGPESWAYRLTQADSNVDDTSSDENDADSGEEAESESSQSQSLTHLDALHDWWSTIIGQYSPRQLTYPSDKFPSLAGLAKEMAKHTDRYHPDRYLAGLWEGNLAQDLLWRFPGGRAHHCRRSPYRAPSWSWATCDTQVTSSTHRGPQNTYTAWNRTEASAIELLDAHIELAGSNPYGAITAASLELRAKREPVILSGPTGRVNARGRPSDFPLEMQTAAAGGARLGVAGLDHPEQEDVAGRIVYGLRVEHQVPGTASSEDHWSGLLLDKTGPGNEFRRIGLYVLDEENIAFFDDKEDRVSVLI